MKNVSNDDCRAILTRTREILSDPDRWTQGTIAVDATGMAVASASDRNAVGWCLLGACTKAARELSSASPNTFLGGSLSLIHI